MLITVEDYTTRYGSGKPVAQIEAHISDVSAEIVDYCEILGVEDAADWGVESDDLPVPDAIVGVCARVVNRAMGNPFGMTQEILGDHQWSAPAGASGGMLGPKDRKIIRRAVRKLGVGTVVLEGDIPRWA